VRLAAGHCRTPESTSRRRSSTKTPKPTDGQPDHEHEQAMTDETRAATKCAQPETQLGCSNPHPDSRTVQLFERNTLIEWQEPGRSCPWKAWGARTCKSSHTDKQALGQKCESVSIQSRTHLRRFNDGVQVDVPVAAPVAGCVPHRNMFVHTMRSFF
jgi:hypothetical protein